MRLLLALSSPLLSLLSPLPPHPRTPPLPRYLPRSLSLSRSLALSCLHTARYVAYGRRRVEVVVWREVVERLS